MAFVRSASLVSRLLRSSLNNPHPAASRSFRATAITASAPKDSSGDDPQAEGPSQIEDLRDAVENFNENAGRMLDELKEKLKGMNPDLEFLFEDFDENENLTDKAHRMLLEVRRRVKSQHTELGARICELLYWHPFLEEGNERPYEVNVDEDNWSARIDMPGIGSKGIRVWFENNNLHFTGEEKDKGPDGRKYMSKFYIPPGEYQVNKISAVLNNGVLNIVVPKIKGSKNENSNAGEAKE